MVGYVDEVGRGPLFGDVVAACVVFKSGDDEGFESKIEDSKKLTERQRNVAFEEIKERCHIGLGIANAWEIDRHNILQATFISMRRAICDCGVLPTSVKVDGDKEIPKLLIRQKAIIGGDGTVFGISCASVIAKVCRDEMMNVYSDLFPGYSLDKNKGYGTKAHTEAILEHGLTVLHRRSFCRKFL